MTQPVGMPSVAILALQTRLIAEETEELCEATRILAFTRQTKEPGIDAQRAGRCGVCGLSTCSSLRVGLRRGSEQSHASNMSKLENGAPVKDEQGKVLKGKNYQPPSLIDLV